MKDQDAKSRAVLAARCHDVTVSLDGKQVGDFEQLVIVGMAVRLALHLRGVPVVPYDLLRQIALHLLKIPTTSLQLVIDLLAEAGFVKVDRQGPTIKAIVPIVPYYEDLFEGLGEIAADKRLSEPEQLTIELLSRLARTPLVKETLYGNLGADAKLVDRMIHVGHKGGYVLPRRTRGKDVILSPIYFPENTKEFAELVAANSSSAVGRVLQILSQNQGWPLKLIQKNSAIGDFTLSSQDVAVITQLAGDGFLPPPLIQTDHAGTNHFLFAPKPGLPNLSPTKRPIFETAMALVAAVRQGQLLPEAYAIRYPTALLRSLKEKKYLRANTEALDQYKELVVLRLGRLVRHSGSWYEFHLIDIPENVEAVDFAIRLVTGSEPMPAVSDDVALAFRKGHDYVESLIARQQLVVQEKIALDPEKKREIDDLLMKGLQ
jgi:hypothetical protein